MIRMTMHLTDKQVEWIREKAKDKGISFAEEMRYILFTVMTQEQEKND